MGLIVNLEDSGVYVTKHGYARMKERLGLNKNAARRMSQKAYEDGIDLLGVKGSLKRFLETKEEANAESIVFKIYGNAVYCFDIKELEKWNKAPEIVLITVYHLPKRYNKQANSARLRRNDTDYVCANIG